MVFAFAAGPRGQSAVDVCLARHLDKAILLTWTSAGRRESGGEFSSGVRSVPRVWLAFCTFYMCLNKLAMSTVPELGKSHFFALLCGGELAVGIFRSFGGS